MGSSGSVDQADGLHSGLLISTGPRLSMLVCTGLCWFLIVSAGLYWSLLVCIGVLCWSLIVCIGGLCWSLIVSTGLCRLLSAVQGDLHVCLSPPAGSWIYISFFIVSVLLNVTRLYVVSVFQSCQAKNVQEVKANRRTHPRQSYIIIHI